jgi:hypothetical protein
MLTIINMIIETHFVIASTSQYWVVRQKYILNDNNSQETNSLCSIESKICSEMSKYFYF